MRRAKPGSVLEVAVAGGYSYLHYIGRHPMYGDAVMVSARTWTANEPVSAEMFRDGYVTFYPARASVSAGLTRIVGQLPSSGLPAKFRRALTRVDRRVLNWCIEDEGNGSNEIKDEAALTQDERRLPIAAIWNHAYLLISVAQRWRPELDNLVAAETAPDAPAPPPGPP